ncbi:MAG: hypothetical protein CHACPFDD_00013 [Phycisphaerae bacterium]|nr:hypothetical protein [Phycisphaerae bacterium]
MLKRGQKLGSVLIEQGLITEQDLERALQAQKTGNRRLGETLIELGIVTSDTLVNAVGRQLGVRGCTIRHGLVDPKAVALLDADEARRLKVLPLFKVEDRLTAAMAEPQSLPTIDRLAKLTGCKINPVLALASNIAEFQEKYRGTQVNVQSFLTTLTESKVEVVESDTSADESSDINRLVEGSPIVNLVNLAIMTAIRDNASDIHVEPERGGTRIRYRVDGVLQELMSPPHGMHSAIVSRIKVIARMDIAERRLPQEGRVHVVAETRNIDLRISTIPTILGEKVVLRILDRSRLDVSLEQLGLEGEPLDRFMSMLRKPHGLVLVTGPTGSGKTTTLYCALEQLSEYGRNVVTVEDPVEYQLDGVNQIQISDAIGLSFPRALRSILRQDPDIILVGEIRDRETAQIAVQAALTGHLVLSTLHTNTSPGAVARLLDMGVEPYLLASALNGVIAQRLVRKNCPHCIASYYPSAEALLDAGRQADARRVYQRGEGCSKCHDTGFAGRVGVYEVMPLDDVLRQQIHNRAGEDDIRRHLLTTSWRPLRDEGVRLADRGLSPLEEVLRVTHTETQSRVRAEAAAGTPAAARPERQEVAT